MLCKRLRVYDWLDQKWLGIHKLFWKFQLQAFVVSLRKLILGIASVWPPEISIVHDLWFQLWIKVQSTSKAVHETFNFSLELLSVLSKQLA